jgi:hypothetical protein
MNLFLNSVSFLFLHYVQFYVPLLLFLAVSVIRVMSKLRARKRVKIQEHAAEGRSFTCPIDEREGWT